MNKEYWNCTGLTNVTFESTIPPTIGENAFGGVSNATFTMPFASILAYKALNELQSKTFASHKVDGIYYLPTSETEVEVTFKDKNYNSYAGDVVIPAEITVDEKKYKVTSIGDYAFRDCSGLKNVTIGNSVTSIGEYAFYNCTDLTNVTIPNSVTSIGYEAFYKCSGLTSVTFESTTPPSIEKDAFSNTSPTIKTPFASVLAYKALNELKNKTFAGHEVDGIYYLPTSETEVEVTFKDNNYNSYAGDVVIPAEITVDDIKYNVTSIGYRAFYKCDSLINVTIPSFVTNIKGYAFYGCNSLTSIIIPVGVTSIGNNAFFVNGSYYDENGNYRDNYITRTVVCNAKIPPTLGSGVFNYNYLTLKVPFASVLAYKAIENWTNVRYGSITYKGKEVDGIYYLPTSETEVEVTYKDKNYNSYSSNVAIPDTIMVDSIKYNVTSIGSYAFYGCDKLNGKLSLPSSITLIGENAFSGTKYSICDIAATTPPTISSSSLSAETSLVLVPTGTPNAYKEADVWKNYTIIAEGSCDIVVTNAKGGELARSILTQTRKNLQNITGLKVKGTLNSIDFELINTNMSSLLHLDITETDVTEIPAEAFKNIVTLMSIKLPSTLQTIGDYAFSGCKVLSGELILPEKLTKIGNYAFQNCSGLSGTLKIPANVTYINSYAFSGCYNIKNIDMTGATKLYEIGNNAFRGCTTIESVDMAGASRLINLGTYVFSGCTGLKSVDMTGAKSLTSLSSYIFNGCNSLEIVLFPETLETIGNYSFYNCAKLDNLKLPAALKSINSSAFNYCTGLKSIDMTEAKSMTSLTSYLFSNLYSLETVLFPETLETIGNNTFYHCTKLNNIKLPAALKSIDSSAFYGCTGMTSIDFSACSSLTTIYGSAFYGCTGLTMLDLSACESLITIKDSAFSGCSALATINFPISLVSIGSNAFAQCTNLLQLSVPCTIPPVIENHAEPFAGVDNIACILSIPSENFFDYYSANYWGGFVDVEGKSEVQNGVNDATDEEDGEGEGDSAGEGDETGKHKKHKGCKVRFKKHHKEGHSPRLMALKGVNTLAETEDVSNTSDLGFTGDGQSLFVGFGESVTYYLTPEEGKEIESVYFNDEDVTSQLVNNTLTVTVTSDMTMTSFVVNMKNASPKLAGDVNGDGEVNVTDITTLISYILGNTEGVNSAVVDINNDGEVNVTDVTTLISMILGTN